MRPTWQVPEHLREDFCGTALISATWCRGDVRRTAIGLDIDHEALQWGLTHHSDGLVDEPRPRLSLFQGDVRDPVDAAEVVRPAASAPSDAAQAFAQFSVTEGQADAGPPADDSRNGSTAQRDGGEESVAQHGSREHASEAGDEEEADGDGRSCAAKLVDISCALNFSVCLLHQRSDVVVGPLHHRSLAA